MRKAGKKRDTDRAQLRLLAWVIALLVALVRILLPSGQQSLFLELTAALIFAVGTVWPQTFRWLKRLFLALAFLVRGR